MFEAFFIRRATKNHISRILREEGFVYTEEVVKKLLSGNQKGVRYGNMVLPHNEAGVQQKRFIKILLDGKRSTFRLFKRQVKISASLHDDKQFTSPTIAVLKQSLTPPVPYAIFETREDGVGFGFMHDSPQFYEQCTESDMQQLVETLYTFHQAGFNISPSTLQLTRQLSSNIRFYKKECDNLLRTRITHKTKDSVEMAKTVEELLAMYSGLTNIRERIMQALEKNFAFVKSFKTSKGFYLVHADMQIDNVYKHQNGDFELLDFEWVGRSTSPVIAIMYDYGNLRARAWSSPSFQKLLDKTMLEVGSKLYPDLTPAIGAGLTLGIVRSSLMMCRYHMDIINTVKKDKRTEEDYFNMFPKSIAALMDGLR